MIGQLGRLTRRQAQARADELLDRFGLSQAAGRAVKTYSGGMRRRLDLAASLVAKPPLLFLDEPTTGLDPQGRRDLWQVIEELVQSGATILLTTQYLEEADRFCEALVVIDHGRIIAAGSPNDLKAKLGETVIALSFADGDVAAKAGELLGDLSEHPLMVLDHEVELTVERGPAKTAEALRRLDAAGLEVTGIVLREPSLDDVFLTITGKRTDAGDGDETPTTKRRKGRR
jgi:ABC-type multidrug transport system ATPase subunit